MENMVKAVLAWVWDIGFRAGYNRSVRQVRTQVCKRCLEKLNRDLPWFSKVDE